MPWRSRPGAVTIASLHARATAMGSIALLAIPGTGWLFLEIDNSLVLVAGALLLTAGLLYGSRLGVVFDDDGVTVRNYFRSYRFRWDEVRRLADGQVKETTEGGTAYFWALAVVPCEGRTVMASGTATKRARPKMLLAIQQASARYAVPSDVTGKRPDPESAAAA